ncbi:MAG: hypothetical protein WA092_02465 [Minisyncoccales bacterium]
MSPARFKLKMGKEKLMGRFVTQVLCIAACIVLLACMFSTGCVGQEKTTVPDPQEYFPLSGTWSYRIDPGTTDALMYRAISDDNTVRIVRSPINFRYGNNYLEYRTVVYSNYGNGDKGTAMEITRDDLGIFKGTKNIFWVVYNNSGLRIYQGVNYLEGTSARPIFFLPPYGERGHIADLLVNEEDSLTYVGLDNKEPGCQTNACMYFIRVVKEGSGAYGYADKGFIEHQWFTKGKGLILLKQEVDGKTSMTWTLERFVPND